MWWCVWCMGLMGWWTVFSVLFLSSFSEILNCWILRFSILRVCRKTPSPLSSATERNNFCFASVMVILKLQLSKLLEKILRNKCYCECNTQHENSMSHWVPTYPELNWLASSLQSQFFEKKTTTTTKKTMCVYMQLTERLDSGQLFISGRNEYAFSRAQIVYFVPVYYC